MRIVVVGASGNAGTGVLRALRDAGDVSSVVAVARRVPRSSRVPAPYDIADWVSIDVGGPSHDEVVTALADAMKGADAVIHLAWAIQPNHDRDRLRRTNVVGTARMLEAARRAGVGHVVIASSVGSYSPAHDDDLHDESWPARGIPASEYSVDKADVEELLDDHEREHPGLGITRLRPALIFQRDAGAQMIRYFIGRWAPGLAFRGGLPVLTWPQGMRLQAVHSDDVGQAYLSAVRRRPGGAINIAAEGVLAGQEVADVLSGGRYTEVPVPAVRAAVSAGWNARVLPVSPGWIDMAMGAPLMSTDRARAELGWDPRHTAAEALADVIGGIADGAGAASAPLRPR